MLGDRVIRIAAFSILLGPVAQGQSLAEQDRITTPEEIQEETRVEESAPLGVLSWPAHKLSHGMERGIIAFERHKIRERVSLWREELRQRGLEARFGGSGEGTGLGGGALYTFRAGEGQRVQLLGLGTFKQYQELDLQWTNTTRAGSLIAESSYQWRPEENFYGLGHDSPRDKHSKFALRQTWAGLRWEREARDRRLRWGALYRTAWLSALSSGNALYGSPNIFFSNLTGFGTQMRLGSGGVYFDLDGIRHEYQLGGAAHFGASYQHGFGDSRLRYFTYETQLEGRLPVSRESSALVGQANFELNRERRGSSPIPFYLLPHIGGSSTLRGFPLDRFYGRNVALLSLEYRYRVHPFIQAMLFFDEGQIFDRTDDLSWLNWHRNYGIGFRLHAASGATFLRMDYGRSSEGYEIHVTFGDRERPPLRGPVRYGAYKR